MQTGERESRSVGLGGVRGGEEGGTSRSLPSHRKSSLNITGLRNGPRRARRCNNASDFPSGGTGEGRGGSWRTSRAETPNQKPSGFVLFVFSFYSLSSSSPVFFSSLPPLKLSLAEPAGQFPTNWGQGRIKLCSYGLIYTSISVDRRGNKILSRLIRLGFCVLANIV